MKKKKSYHHGDLKQSLLNATVDLIAERQRPEFTLREIAAALDVTHAAAYHHFRDKEALLALIADQGYEALDAMLSQSAQSEGGLLAELFALGAAYLKFALEHPAHFRVMFDPKFGDPQRYPSVYQRSQTTRTLLGDLLCEAQRKELLAQNDPAELIAVTWAALHGLAVLTLDGHFDHMNPTEDVDAFFRRVFQYVILGAATDQGSTALQSAFSS